MEEKLRSYFEYWLSVCNIALDKQVVNDAVCEKTTIYDKIILVIEGIDCFIDTTNHKEAIVAFWLPRFFPKRIKIICTADKHSNSFKYF